MIKPYRPLQLLASEISTQLPRIDLEDLEIFERVRKGSAIWYEIEYVEGNLLDEIIFKATGIRSGRVQIMFD
jgi:hypothetical protein